ncbi:MAG TPA: serine hydrolase domain-containing protein [Armatimonadota bacterium]|nr:serine hydrolase domain-containing protein [Armatimonadota bacterium]
MGSAVTRTASGPDVFAPLRAVLEGVVDSGAVPGIVVATGTSEATRFLRGHGWAQVVPTREPMRAYTLFDLASLTKVVVTTSLVGILCAEGRIDMEGRLDAYLTDLVGDAKGAVTVHQLLTHTSGLPAWRPFYRHCATREQVRAAVLAEPLADTPGARRTYSDLGFVLLGEVLERVSGQRLAALARERLFRPLGMLDTGFVPPSGLAARAAATEVAAGHDLPKRGCVHDENAAAMGGVSGHAGLFSTASDLARFARMMLRGGRFEGRDIIPRPGYEALFVRDPSGPAGWCWRGWVGIGPEDAVARVFSTRAFGHTGFTGTSLWCDPARDAFVVCLTNAVHPSREGNRRISEVRMSVYESAVECLRRQSEPR